jgi:cardiolipin synthase (CMP-forming)
MTFPNLITLFRILLTPVLVWMLLDDRFPAALAVFFLAGATDGLDGLVARVFHQKSKLGAYLDPLADKFLLVSSFVVLALLGRLPPGLAVIVVVRDCFIVLGLAALLYRHVRVEIKPVALSKATTAFELLTVLAVLGADFLTLPGWGYLCLFAVTAIFCVLSGGHYLWIGMSLLNADRSRS